ncbi:MAG: DNA ligase D [Taibaiella sp.]|nr:DNA ligase D [Taibaiella sp.]
MLAKLDDKAFDSADWVFEIKWDGYRAVAEINKQNTRLYSRNGLSFKDKYPQIFEALGTVKKNVVLDGEVVAFDSKGMPSFQLLQQYDQDNSIPLVYYVFDCLYLDGRSLEDKPLLERKDILKKLLPKSELIKFCDHIAEKGKDFFDAVTKQNLEGMIAKRANSTYQEGSRSADWLKIKHVQTEEAIIAGYTAPRGGRKNFGALVLATHNDKGKLEYIGHTGTGFNDKTLKSTYDRLQSLITDTSPFDKKVVVNSPVTWVKPVLVCNIKFTEITRDGNRRHPVFLGLRVDKTADEVTKDNDKNTTADMTDKKAGTGKAAASKSASINKTVTVANKTVGLTHLDKIFWPEEGYTKGDVIAYYQSVYKYMGKYLKGRPESLMRTPNGVKGGGFFHKDAGDNAPAFVDKWASWSDSAEKEINYIVCNNEATLLYMANMGCIEINPWNSTIKKPDNPDYVILDLDPSEKNTYDQVVDTALVIKDILDSAGATSYCKTSGSSGMHVYVPLGAKYDYEHAKEFAHMIAALASEQLPDITTLERSLSKRQKDHIYVDYLQNRRGQTLSAVYSLRPKPGAPVSTPLEWKEVKHGMHPAQFNIENTIKRIEKKGDIFKGVLGKGIDMKKCIKNLGG